MAEPKTSPLLNEHDDQEALKTVREHLQASDRFKREFWPTEKVMNRRRAYEGDPEAYGFPYEDVWGHRPVNNWMFRQINHKISKLTKAPERLNLKHKKGDDSDATRLMLSALTTRLQQKGREAGWPMGRRLMALDAAKVGFGVRCVGIRFHRDRYKLWNWRVRAEEYHMDPTAEGMDDAAWKSWRRLTIGEKLGDTLKRLGEPNPSGAGSQLMIDSRPMEIALSDDRILAFGRNLGEKGSAMYGNKPYIVTDHYIDDSSQDIYYPCPACDRMVGMSKVKDISGVVVPQFKCPACGHEAEGAPPRELMNRIPRYPNGWHIRLVESEVDYNGPNRLKLETGDPFVGFAWYDGEAWPGYSETQLLTSPQILNNVAMAMLSDNAFSNAHPKVMVPKGGIEGGWNNNPNDYIELSSAAWASGGAKRLDMGDVSPAVRLLLEYSKQDMYLLPGLSPESQGQAPETLRSGVGLAQVVAASEVGLYLPLDSLLKADARFYRIARDLCAMIDQSADIPMVNQYGIPGSYAYDRSLMKEPFDIEVLTDKDVDQEREQLFSRAMEMKVAQVQGVDDEMILELSGIPADMVQRAKQRLAAQAFAQSQMGMPPSIGTATPRPSMGGGEPQMGARAQTEGPMNKMMGRLAPSPTRPPSRSRGSALVSANGNGAGR